MVEEIGLPLSDFFMDIFDLEYSIRARSRGYKIAVITSAKLVHEVGNTRQINLPGYKRLWLSQPPWREYYFCRNLIYLAWRLYPNRPTKVSIARFLGVHLVQVLLFSSQRFACVIKLLQGFRDGWRGKLGIRVMPAMQRLREPAAAVPLAEKTGSGPAI